MNTTDKLEQAYERMVQHIFDWREKAREEGREVGNWFKQAAEDAIETEVELERLTRDEANKVINYLAQDLHDAAKHARETEEEMAFWWNFDVSLMEDRFHDAFVNAADPTAMGQFLLARQLEERSELHTGEVSAPGTLACKSCGKEIHFHKPGHIPPCSACHDTKFQRVTSKS